MSIVICGFKESKWVCLKIEDPKQILVFLLAFLFHPPKKGVQLPNGPPKWLPQNGSPPISSAVPEAEAKLELEAAQLLPPGSVDAVDLNCGCPQADAGGGAPDVCRVPRMFFWLWTFREAATPKIGSEIEFVFVCL